MTQPAKAEHEAEHLRMEKDAVKQQEVTKTVDMENEAGNGKKEAYKLCLEKEAVENIIDIVIVRRRKPLSEKP